MIQSIQDDNCWVCGIEVVAKENKTSHHVLPKHLNPKNNITVPVCISCHHKITSDDPQAIITFTYKLFRETEDLRKKVSSLQNMIEQKTINSIIKKVKK